MGRAVKVAMLEYLSEVMGIRQHQPLLASSTWQTIAALVKNRLDSFDCSTSHATKST
jgi:hypothetical protein